MEFIETYQHLLRTPATLLEHGIAVVVLLFCLIHASITDLQTRQIKNQLVIGLAVAGLFLVGVLLGGEAIVRSAIAVAVVLIVTLPLYLLGGLGAGDVKLLASVSIYFSPASSILMITMIFLVAGVWVATSRILPIRVLVHDSTSSKEKQPCPERGSVGNTNSAGVSCSKGIPLAPAILLGTAVCVSILYV